MADWYVKDPGKVLLGGRVELEFAAWLRWFVDRDDRYNLSGKGIRAGVRLEAAIEEMGKTGVLKQNEEDRNLLREVANNPIAGGKPLGYPDIVITHPNGDLIERKPVARDQLPFLDALESASTEPPAVVAPESRQVRRAKERRAANGTTGEPPAPAG